MINGFIVLNEVLSYQECADLIKYYDEHGPTYVWGKTFPMTITPERELPYRMAQKILHAIQPYIKETVEIDWCELVKWPEGANQDMHFDTAKQRTVFTSITNLNVNYTGGVTRFLNDTAITPKVGRTTYFDGMNAMHGVSTLETGTRYTLAIWYKGDQYVL